ncbi:probable phosphoglycerate mutase [Sinosporangium album]|uniref:Probable phosphoglycerate mutase n=1 Tax=Sinosporangium album TaxID=504805 RepID=A0A1G8CAR3_9ACTN|nr:histidine phosphatase family protein [Sinosporangium album]SDH42465.1 probable phosphoglycerate mutase [Sinosporangium album]
MISYLVRHGRTGYSATYRLNGDPGVPVGLDSVGRQQCRIPVTGISRVAFCLTSGFLRARQSAELMLSESRVPIAVDTRLNELDYGDFEGKAFSDYAHWLAREGSGRRPPGSVESQREGIRRILSGLRAAPLCPGPRLIVTHGLAVSVLRWCQASPSTSLTDLFFPEAPYVTALGIFDDELVEIADQRIAEIDLQSRQIPGQPAF